MNFQLITQAGESLIIRKEDEHQPCHRIGDQGLDQVRQCPVTNGGGLRSFVD
ncbi:MAG: hypothetical protein KF726_24715 [Anaerolineae bacterium]|nr:hypothetical protein [Anaerolineae bacterium]